MAELWGLEGSVSFFMRRTVHSTFIIDVVVDRPAKAKKSVCG